MKVYQCDRCKNIYEPRRLNKGEMYLTHKSDRTHDVDLCPNCMQSLYDWFKEAGNE